jgi:CheY-like chemotaxis protein
LRSGEGEGGEIGFESVEGAGSRFWIDMPVYVASQRDQEHGADVTIPSEAPQLAGFSVLYVEDNSANLTLMRNLFGTMHDIRLIEAVDGASGLAMAKEHHPDLIILDVNLPDTNGLSLLRQIRELNEFASTPVMALSSNAIPSSIKRGLDAGFCEYLTKPLDVNRFLKAVDAALAGARAARNTDAPARATMSA